MDVRYANDQDDREQNDSAGKPPTAVRFGGNVLIDMFRHRLPLLVALVVS
jgi:hypothetical protein